MNNDFTIVIYQKSDDELCEIYLSQEKYQKEFYAAAVQEVHKRGIDVTGMDAQIKEKIIENDSILKEGKDGNSVYLILCFLGALVGGIPAMIGGYIYAFSKVTGLNGNKYYVYNSTTRKLGKVIFYLGIAVALIALFVKMPG